MGFTYLIVILEIYILLEKLIRSILHGPSVEYLNRRITNIKSLLISLVRDGRINIYNLFAVALLVTVLWRPNRYYLHLSDLYRIWFYIFISLSISKWILLGNGLKNDFYLGSEINMRCPPFVQALNAWPIHSFEYSSMRVFTFYSVFLLLFLYIIW
jgi:hypothetical protein